MMEHVFSNDLCEQEYYVDTSSDSLVINDLQSDGPDSSDSELLAQKFHSLDVKARLMQDERDSVLEENTALQNEVSSLQTTIRQLKSRKLNDSMASLPLITSSSIRSNTMFDLQSAFHHKGNHTSPPSLCDTNSISTVYGTAIASTGTLCCSSDNVIREELGRLSKEISRLESLINSCNDNSKMINEKLENVFHIQNAFKDVYEDTHHMRDEIESLKQHIAEQQSTLHNNSIDGNNAGSTVQIHDFEIHTEKYDQRMKHIESQVDRLTSENQLTLASLCNDTVFIKNQIEALRRHEQFSMIELDEHRNPVESVAVEMEHLQQRKASMEKIHHPNDVIDVNKIDSNNEMLNILESAKDNEINEEIGSNSDQSAKDEINKIITDTSVDNPSTGRVVNDSKKVENTSQDVVSAMSESIDSDVDSKTITFLHDSQLSSSILDVKDDGDEKNFSSTEIFEEMSEKIEKLNVETIAVSEKSRKDFSGNEETSDKIQDRQGDNTPLADVRNSPSKNDAASPVKRKPGVVAIPKRVYAYVVDSFL